MQTKKYTKIELDGLVWLTSDLISSLGFEQKGILLQLLMLHDARQGKVPSDSDNMRILCNYHDKDRWGELFPDVLIAYKSLSREKDVEITSLWEPIRIDVERFIICFGTDTESGDNIWSLGVKFLCSTGGSEGAARGLIGKLSKQFGERNVQAAISAASILKKDVADPRSWLFAAVKRETEKNGNGGSTAKKPGKGSMAL